MQRLTIISCILLVISLHWTGAFIVGPTSTTRSSRYNLIGNPLTTSTATTPKLNNGLFMAARNLEELESSYGERTRPYRRDFFTHDSWVRHRSPDRYVFFDFLKTPPPLLLLEEVSASHFRGPRNLH